MEKNYPKGAVDEVLDEIGGKVKANNFENTCSIRMSRALNYSGVKIDKIKPNLTVTGKDGKWYIYRVKVMIKYLTSKFGAPDLTITNTNAIQGMKGIVYFDCQGAWGDATGHITLWNGISFIRNDSYFPEAQSVKFWQLKN
jgi:hypothetical protein